MNRCDLTHCMSLKLLEAQCLYIYHCQAEHEHQRACHLLCHLRAGPQHILHARPCSVALWFALGAIVSTLQSSKKRPHLQQTRTNFSREACGQVPHLCQVLLGYVYALPHTVRWPTTAVQPYVISFTLLEVKKGTFLLAISVSDALGRFVHVSTARHALLDRGDDVISQSLANMPQKKIKRKRTVKIEEKGDYKQKNERIYIHPLPSQLMHTHLYMLCRACCAIYTANMRRLSCCIIFVNEVLLLKFQSLSTDSVAGGSAIQAPDWSCLSLPCT